jgi:acyl-CoA synthetase (AMP-forming)/AMP-acid ligase II
MGEEKKTVYELLQRSARLFPNKTALVFHRSRLSYEDVQKHVDRLASVLKGLGVPKGETFAVRLPNSPELVVAFYALAKLGAITVWINPMYAGEQLDFILSDSLARGMITDSSAEETKRVADIKSRREKFPHLEHILQVEINGDAGLLGNVFRDHSCLPPMGDAASEDEACMLIYTSGATGVPKGAPATHGQVIREASVYTEALRATETDIFLAALPMYHSYGFISLLIQGVALAATLVVMEKWNPDEALGLIERERVTVHLAAPTHYIMELKSPEFLKRDLSSLRAGLISGYVPPSELMLEIDEKMKFHFCNFWGSSETGPGLISPWGSPREKRLFTAGKPVEGEQVRMVDPESMQELAVGEVGEVVVKGWNVLHGYWKNPDETKRHFDEQGWFHTGDLAFTDQDGFVTIVGRTKDQINRGGLKIVPHDLEKQIASHPAVVSVSVVGTSNPVLGESICACVIPRTGEKLDLMELREFLRAKVGTTSLPDELLLTDEFPMLSGGVKINKYGSGGLRDMAERHAEKQQWWRIKKDRGSD